MDKIIVVDVDKCMACLACEVECAIAHSKLKTWQETMKQVEPRINVEAVEQHAVPIKCCHCEDAPCVKICPTEALNRPDPEGPVQFNEERCIGCKYCIVVCPFGAIAPSHDGNRIVKCDLCSERLKAGQEPACVASCPTKAIVFVDAEKYAQDKRAETAKQSIEQPGDSVKVEDGKS